MSPPSLTWLTGSLLTGLLVSTQTLCPQTILITRGVILIVFYLFWVKTNCYSDLQGPVIHCPRSPLTTFSTILPFTYSISVTLASYSSSNTPDILPPQGLCTCCSFCLEHFSLPPSVQVFKQMLLFPQVPVVGEMIPKRYP